MPNDNELLRRYADARSEEAFAQFVEGNMSFVYQAALRRTNGDMHLAEDVVQLVFSSVARNAASVARHAVPAGWLYVTTRNCAANLMRAERRRKAREREAMNAPKFTHESESPPDWGRLRPELDAVIDKLERVDREAVLLRCLQGRPFAEVGRILRTSEDGARKRVERALERLRDLLARRGITSTAAALAAALEGQAGLAAPAGLAAHVTGLALASAGPPVALLMSTTKVSLAAAIALAIAAGGTLLVQHRREVKLERDIARLHLALDRHAGPLAGEPISAGAAGDAVGAQSAGPRAGPSATSPKAPASGSIPWPSLTGGMVRSSDWKNRGTATPMQTMQSYLWAVDRIDVGATADTIGFGQLKGRVDAFYEALPESIRAEYDSPEKLWAMILSGAPHGVPIASYGIVSQSPDPAQPENGVVMHVVIDGGDGTTTQGDVRLELTPTGWRYTLRDNLILPVLGRPNAALGAQ